MTRVLFCFYPLFVKYNHGIALLSSICRKSGINTSLYVLDNKENFSRYLSSRHFDFIGFSVVTSHDFMKSIPFMAVARDAIPDSLIMLGGTFLSGIHGGGGASRIEASLSGLVDRICYGDAEELTRFILEGCDSIFTSPRQCKDIQSLPLPDHNLFMDIPFDRGLPFLQGKRVLPYYSSRGCPFQCSFCQVRWQRKKVLIRSRVAADLSFLAGTYFPDLFFIGDELLPYYSRRWRESWHDFRYPFCCYIRPDIQPKILEWLIDRGMTACAFGVESGNEWYRINVLKKRVTDKKVFETVRILGQNGIDYVPFFMTGLPGETMANQRETFDMSRLLGGFPFVFQYEDLSQTFEGGA